MFSRLLLLLALSVLSLLTLSTATPPLSITLPISIRQRGRCRGPSFLCSRRRLKQLTRCICWGASVNRINPGAAKKRRLLSTCRADNNNAPFTRMKGDCIALGFLRRGKGPPALKARSVVSRARKAGRTCKCPRS